MRFLKTNTATRITVGPFFDKTDGVTPETAITVTSCKLTLTVDDGGVPTLVLDTNPTASGGANDMVHITGDDAGFYDLELAAGNVNYVGRAMIAITDAATHCPVFHEFMILPANVYDSLVGGTDVLDVSVTQWLGTAAATPTVAGVPEVDVTHFNGTAGTFASGIPAVNATQISGDATAADNAEAFFDGTGYAGTNNVIPTVTTLTGHTPQTGDAYAIVNSGTHGNAAINTKLGTPSDLGNGATIAFNLSDIHTDTAAIDAIAAKLSGLVMASEVIGSTGNSTTAIHLSTLTYGNDEINDHLLVIYDNSTGEFHSRWVTAWSNASKLATVATLPFTPENAVDTYYLTSIRRDMTAATVSDKTGYSISGTTTTFDALQTALNSAHGAGSWATATGFSTHSATDVWAAGTRTLTAATNISGPIADQVWEEAIADHSGTAGSTAEALNAAGSAGDPWNTALPGAYTSGKAGYIVGTFLDAAISSRSTVTTAQVNTEVDTALADIHLDHLIASADPGSVVANSSFLAKLVSKSATPAFSSYDNTTDSLEALRDRGDAAWITATGFSTHSAADVWAAGTRTLTAGTNIQLPSNGLANVTAWTVAITGNITGNLSGSVGSVTGAVGSVTGNVGGNVTGSVGSVLGGINTTAGVITTLDALDTAQDTQHSTTQGLVTTVDTVVDSILVDTTQIKADLPTRPTKNTALANFPFVMRLTSDHVTGATGKTVTATRRIDNGSFAACANSASEVSNGVYTINLAATDLNGDTILLRFTAADCDDTFILIVTQP